MNTIIEFKQIIGRGTRLFDGKDYFTIYDYVKAHLNFMDPEWDGEPLEPEPCPKCGERPCVCDVKPPEAVCRLRQNSVRMSERTLPDLRPTALCLSEKEED